MRTLREVKTSAFAALVLAGSGIPLAGSDARAEGDDTFKPCRSCHEIGAGAKHKVGPHLDKIMGRTAGAVEGFNFSKAMREAGEKGLAWSRESIDEYLQKPRDFIPGNRMSYRGMDKPEERAALIDWLERESRAEAAADPVKVVSAGDEEARSFTDIALRIKGDPEYGEYLSGECVTCHQVSGHAEGIPSIVGLPADYFIRSMFEYKTNVRSNEVMKLRVANIGNEEIAALAAYFSSLTPQ
ncbi:MAG: c-type cytochrome [Rhizobiaceae bacterium]